MSFSTEINSHCRGAGGAKEQRQGEVVREIANLLRSLSTPYRLAPQQRGTRRAPRETDAMTSLDRAASAGNHIGLLDKERIIAPADYNRWLVPTAALAIHLCIGMAYGFSVFWLPLGRAVGVAQGLGKPIPCPGDATTFWGKVAITGHALFATDCDWTQFDLGWMSPCS